MSDTSIEDRLSQIVTDIMGPTATFADMDSLDTVEFYMEAEDEFDVQLPDTITSGFTSIDQVANYIAVMTAGPLHGSH